MWPQRDFDPPQHRAVHAGLIAFKDDAVQHRASVMDAPIPSNPRASRNMAEKQRRDNLNTNISTMATLVPSVSCSSRRLDKISVLRLAATFLRTQYTIGSGLTDFLPSRFGNFDLEQYVVDNLIGNTGFLIVLTTSGKIVYISRHVEQHLGHAQTELLGQNLYDYIDPDDHVKLTKNLNADSFCSSSRSDNDDSNSCEEIATILSDGNTQEQRRTFNVRISHRAASRREHTQYECFHVSGILRLAEACKNNDTGRSRRENASSNDVIFVGMARLLKKRTITELSLLEANKDEYVTRHLPDGRIIFCDHRISVVAGYMSEEVSGLSAFGFMHKEDVLWTLIALRQMYVQRDGYGSSCYRLLSKTGEFIFLRTHGYLEFDKKTNTLESFVCINTLLPKKEGEELVKEMKGRFSATVTGTNALEGNEELALCFSPERSDSQASVEDPSQLEDAISHLFRDLPSPAISEDRVSPSPMPNTQFVKAAMYSQRLPPASLQASKMGLKRSDLPNVVSPNTSKSWKSTSSTSTTPAASPQSDSSSHATIKDNCQKALSPSSCSSQSRNSESKPRVSKKSIRANKTQNSQYLESDSGRQPFSPQVTTETERNLLGFVEESDALQPKSRKRPLGNTLEHNNGANKRRPNETCHLATLKPVANMSMDNGSETSLLNHGFEMVPPSDILLDPTVDFNNFPDSQLISDDVDLRDLQMDQLGLENPELMRLLDNFRSPLERTEEDSMAQPFIENDQVVNDELRRTHLQLANSMALRESQFNVLERDLEDPTLQAQRDSFSQLQAEHNMQKQMLKTLQQDHRSMQVNVKHDIGV